MIGTIVDLIAENKANTFIAIIEKFPSIKKKRDQS